MYGLGLGARSKEMGTAAIAIWHRLAAPAALGKDDPCATQLAMAGSRNCCSVPIRGPSSERRAARSIQAPRLQTLEDRTLQAVTKIIVGASPSILFPPNGRIENVRFTGTVTEDKAGRPKPVATYQVTDLYHQYSVIGVATLTPISPTQYSLFAKIPFPVSSSTRSNPAGRHFYITFTAANKDELNQFQVVPVFVPPKNYVFPKKKPPKAIVPSSSSTATSTPSSTASTSTTSSTTSSASSTASTSNPTPVSTASTTSTASHPKKKHHTSSTSTQSSNIFSNLFGSL